MADATNISAAREQAPTWTSAAVVARLRLVSLSFLMLFVELGLIRWTAANNTYLAYVTNFVLLASFLGIGIGFLRCGRRPALLPWAPVALALLVGFVLAFPASLAALHGPHELQGAFGLAALPRWLSLTVIFVLTVATMTAIGHGVAESFVQFRPLEAYRLDILGSIGGIVVFSALAFLWLPPIAWGTIAVVLLALLVGRHWQQLALVVVVVLLAIESTHAHDHWSPYYKITTDFVPLESVANVPTHDVLAVWANNIPHQTAFPIATLHRIERFYFFPYRHVDRRRLDEVLVVGAGTGNDVAVALAEGAKHVDAVEIDPVIVSLGRRYHADRPYSSRRVSVHVNDGRAYLESTGKRYDLILFALPDSLTLLAGQGNLRLENYLFTRESMQTVRRHLKPGGTFAMYNYYEPFLLDRYAGTLKAVFGAAPCVELGDTLANRQQAVLTAGAGVGRRCLTHWRGRHFEAPTDDHPFPYLARRTIPPFYWHLLLLVLAASLVLVRSVGGTTFRSLARYLDLAFMGAAFLLLETKNIVQFALLFGTTWFVNSLVFAGILLSVYLAVETARHLRLPRPAVLYACLLLAIALAWAVPSAWLLRLSPVPRFCAAAALAFAPIFIANLVFAQRFRAVASSTTAFAANLLGAMIGGMLEYLALVTGYRLLLILVAFLYGLAFLVARRGGVLNAAASAG